MHQVIVFSCHFGTEQFCLQKAEIKNENVDCEVYQKPDVMKFIPQESFPVPTMSIC